MCWSGYDGLFAASARNMPLRNFDKPRRIKAEIMFSPHFLPTDERTVNPKLTALSDCSRVTRSSNCGRAADQPKVWDCRVEVFVT
jgi:hypothetical protein